jgi:hypothetical protein
MGVPYVLFADGQSNMGAPGGVPTGSTSPALGSKIDRVYIWNNALGGFDELIVGVNTAQPPYDPDKLDRFGLEVGFARRFRVLRPNDDLLIVKRARGGTSSVQDPPDDPGGNWNPALTGNLWEGYVKEQIRPAVAKAGPAAVFLRIQAQGEADRTPVIRHPIWEASIRAQTRQLMAMTGQTLRTVQMRLTSNGSDEQNVIDATADFRAMQERLENDDTLNLRLANFDALTKLDDDIHFDFAGTLDGGEIMCNRAFAA